MPDLNDFHAFKSTTSGISGSSSRRSSTGGGGDGGNGDGAGTLLWVAAILSLLWIISIFFS